MELNQPLHDGQYAVATDTHRFRIICAGRRWGKSVLARLILLKWAVTSPGLYWIVSPSYRQSKQNHWDALKKEIPPNWILKKNEVDLSLTLRNGSVIQLKGAENPDTLRGVKLRGLVIDEIASIRSWNWLWSEVLRPTLTDYEAPALFISTPKGYNHFYKLFEMGQRGEQDRAQDGHQASPYRSWRFTSYDNPYIPKAEIAAAREELTEDTFSQEYMADFRKYTGLVYKEFERAVHVADLPDFQPVFYLRGLDRGFRNPTALPLIGVDADDRWYQTHELYATGLTNPQLAESLNSLCMGYTFELSTMDSANQSDMQELNDLGFDFIGVRKQPGEANINYVRYKIQKFAERLRLDAGGTPRYRLHPRCVNTIREFETYSWPEKTVEVKAEPENPEKLNDHMMDALADLNAMYLHTYSPKEHKPWEGKIPGTYIEPSVVEEEENDWGRPVSNDDWEVAA